MRRTTLLLALAALGAMPAPAAAIPVFARRYRMSCAACHNPVPALTEFGEAFAGNGFRLFPGEPPRDTMDTGDELLALQGGLPLAVRLDLYVQAYAGSNAAADFEAPYGLKLLSSAPISTSLSYYFYGFLAERGEVAGLEDAYLHWNDAGGVVDVMLGQFQLSDPMFKRETRLTFEDYAAYRARVGDAPTDLTYDRGVYGVADVAGVTLSGLVVNGNGIGEADDARRFDDDPLKTAVLHARLPEVGPLRLGGFGLYGETRADGLENRTTMVGVDASLGAGPLALSVQYLHREDTHPRYLAGEPTVATDGGFAELMFRPGGSRWYGVALYNLVVADAPLLDVRLGGPAGVRRWETVSGGGGYVLRRNLRLMTELGYNLDAEDFRWTSGFVVAF